MNFLNDPSSFSSFLMMILAKLSTFLKAFLITFLVFISPVKGMIGLISLAVAIDTAFAIFVSVKLKGWKSYRSTKLFNIVVKTFFYTSTILLGFLIDTFIFDGSVMDIQNLICKVMTVFWLYIEGKSMDEKSQKLGNKSIWVLLKDLIKKTKDLKKDINEIKE